MAGLTEDIIPKRFKQLRLLAHSRRLVFVVMPLGALIGLLLTGALSGLQQLEPLISAWGIRTHLVILLPAIGLFLTTLWLTLSGIGEVSLFHDLDLAHTAPHAAFPFRKSMAKVLACVLTIGFGGSAGVEGPGKWLGAALGLQYHRVSGWLSHRLSPIRRLHANPLIMVEAGAASALSAVFRAPLSGALMAAEHHGQVTPGALIPCVVASATGYVVFSSLAGTTPLFPQARPYQLHPQDLAWAFLLGIAIGAGANAYFWFRKSFGGLFGRIPLVWRGLTGGLGLTLLLLPARFFWGGASSHRGRRPRTGPPAPDGRNPAQPGRGLPGAQAPGHRHHLRRWRRGRPLASVFHHGRGDRRGLRRGARVGSAGLYDPGGSLSHNLSRPCKTCNKPAAALNL